MEISCLRRIISIDSFLYKLAIDRHESCRFTLSLYAEDERACAGLLGQSCELKDETGFQFTGSVTEVFVERRMGYLKADILVQGKTAAWDRERRCRVFQDSEKKASDIFKLLNMPGVRYKAENDGPISEIVIQDHETDWEFAKRISRSLGKHIFPGNHAWIGDPLNETVEVKDEDIISVRYTLSEAGRVCIARLKKKLSFGVRVKICGFEYFAAEITYRRSASEVYVYEYTLKAEASGGEPAQERVYTLRAKVTDNKDPKKLGRVKVEYLEPYADEMKKKAIWISCYSLWASKQLGIGCVPLTDDLVLVRICGSSAYVISEIRETPFDDRFEDPRTRYVFLGKQTYVSINETEARIDFGENTRILIEDGSVSAETQKCSVRVENDRINLDADSGRAELSGGLKLNAEELSFEIGGKASITAANVDIKGKSGVSIN